MNKQILFVVKVSVIALAISIGSSYVYAWVAPTVAAPGGNVAAPINTGTTAQTKSGPFTATSLTTAGAVTAPSYCIGASCITAWPTPPAGSTFLDTSATAQTKAGGLTVGGLTIPAGSTITGGGANTLYGALTINGSKTGWAGINFPGAGTVMMHPSYSGFYNAADTAWRMLVTDTGGTGAWGNGNVYANDYYSYAAGKWMSAPAGGVTSLAAGTGISASATTGSVTVANTGVTKIMVTGSLNNISNPLIPATGVGTGVVTLSAPSITCLAGQAVTAIGVSNTACATVGADTLATVVSRGNTSGGIVANGGTYGVYGTGTSIGTYGTGPSIGVRGDGGTYGLLGAGTSVGVRGDGTTYGVYGASAYVGVRGDGSSMDFYGLHGEYTSGATWVNGSDRNIKENFVNLNNQEILNKIIELPITEWNYKTVKDSKHIGPVAQEFYSIFALGDNDTSISTIDPAGISLVGIKALNEKIEVQQKEIEDLKKINSNLENRLTALENKI